LAPEPDSSSPPSGTGELYDFLAPAAGPGEMGRLGPYRVLGVLGAGGMGVVFRAEDPQLRRLVALKVARPALAAGAAARRRLLREARAAAAFTHDHVVPVYQVGEEGGVPFLALPLLAGESLEARLRREGRLPVADVLRIGREVAAGLAAAHERGLVHRDVKPANLWLEALPGQGDGSAPAWRVKILDFGLAHAIDGDAGLSDSVVVAGTPAYMAPEQARGEALDGRCDLFGLGCVLYRSCTGRVAFGGSNALAVLRAVEVEQPRPPAALNPEVPPGLSDLIGRLLAKRAADRPQGAREVVEALGVLERAWAARPPARARRRLPSRRFLAAAGLLALALLVALFVPRFFRGATSEGAAGERAGARRGAGPWPIDSLRAEQVPEYERAVAGGRGPEAGAGRAGGGPGRQSAEALARRPLRGGQPRWQGPGVGEL
jgi:serine/threonine protein kinase